jgi:hypothetical protein
MAAGDIACGSASTGASCAQALTSDLLVAQQPNAVLLLGDNQYECGDLGDFNTYFDPTWGRERGSVYPAIGNHEYTVQLTPTDPCFNRSQGAPGYWAYFGARSHPLDPNCSLSCTGYYSFDVGTWHVIAINSNCGQVAGGCGANSAQEQWLRQDLAAHQNSCTLAYWHHPYYSSGQHGNNLSMAAIWQALYDNGAEVVLNGHDHDYEQFSPQDPAGNLDVNFGIREFIVGTGGRNMTSAGVIQANSELFSRTSFGVLKLVLHTNGYDWQFVPAPGFPQISGASGTALCHGPKTALSNLVAGTSNDTSGQAGFSSTVRISIWAAIAAIGAVIFIVIRFSGRFVLLEAHASTETTCTGIPRRRSVVSRWLGRRPAS